MEQDRDVFTLISEINNAGINHKLSMKQKMKINKQLSISEDFKAKIIISKNES